MSYKTSDPSRVLPGELPEDFFDSQKKNKKAQEDDLTKELEQFEREMAALEAESEQQLKEEFEKLQDEKNIDELDQQLEQWKRIVELEKRAEGLQNKTLSEKPSKKLKIDSDTRKNPINGNESANLEENDDDDLSNIEDFEDKLLNWRSKGI